MMMNHPPFMTVILENVRGNQQPRPDGVLGGVPDFFYQCNNPCCAAYVGNDIAQRYPRMEIGAEEAFPAFAHGSPAFEKLAAGVNALHVLTVAPHRVEHLQVGFFEGLVKAGVLQQQFVFLGQRNIPCYEKLEKIYSFSARIATRLHHLPTL